MQKGEIRIVKNRLKVKDVDSKQGIVQFYYSESQTRDRHGDVVTLEAHKGTKVDTDLKHFKNHNPYMTPGVVKEVGTDSVGAWAVSQLMKNTVGKDTLIEYEAGAITQHSFGFEAVKEKMDTATGTNYITEVKTWEVSSLTHWGANKNTPVVGLKDLDSMGLEDALEMLKSIKYILHRTSISDERAKEFQKEYDRLESYVKKENDVDKFILKNIKL